MLIKHLRDHSIERPLQYFLAFLCLLVYAGSLFFPLADKDAGHHANIALYMYEHDTWVHLVDRGKDYLDKPHVLFWSSLVSFKLFGVNTFAHRFPAVIFALVSLYSTYKLTRHLSGKTMAKLALAMLATAQAFVFSINDARMETPLTAGIIFGLWQLIVYINNRKFLNIILAALGASVAFATKGWIGPIVMFIPAFFYILLNKKWNVFASLKTWSFILFFFLFISPVLYAYYIQFDLHPEKIIRGKSGRSGIHFILWDQLFERSAGFDQGKKGRNSDYFFLYHTFLWAFFPWCLFACLAVAFWFKRMLVKKKWRHPVNFAVLAFAFILFSISFSNFKMPHYIIMLLPLAAIFTAPYLALISSYKRSLKWAYPIQVFFAILVILATLLMNYYFFPPRNLFVWTAGSALIIALLFLIVKKHKVKESQLVYISISISLVFNFFMNYNFFPSLFSYQGGNQLPRIIEDENMDISHNKIMVLEHNAHSFEFYRKHIYPVIDQQTVVNKFDSLSEKYFLMNQYHANHFREQGFIVEDVATHADHNVTTITLKFLNPETRQVRDSLILARLSRP